MHKRFTAPLLLAVTLLGCRLGDISTPRVDGTFEATAFGDYNAALQGAAEFGVYQGEGFSVVLRPRDGTHLIGIGHRDQVRPTPGTYQVGDPAAEGVFFATFLRSTADGIWELVSDSGTVTITSSTAVRMDGSFHLRTKGYLGTPFVATVEIAGTFSASCAAIARCE
jgi:hypothetical protein